MSKRQMGFLFEQQFCIGCQTCMDACAARNGLPSGVFPRHADNFQQKIEGPYLSMSCNHCTNPACVEACPVGALQKRDSDGIVVHDRDACIGCYSCVSACPYGAPQQDDEAGKMVKCDLCLGLQEIGEEPACVAACPAKVLSIGWVDEMDECGYAREGEGMTVESTDPNIRFVPDI